MKILFPDLHDDKNVTKQADGTYSVTLAPWFDEPIHGIPSLQLAREFLHAAHEAMHDYADTAMSD